MLNKWLQQCTLLFDGLDYVALKQVNDTTQGRRLLGSYFLILEDGTITIEVNVILYYYCNQQMHN